MDQLYQGSQGQTHFLDYWRVVKTRKVLVLLLFMLVVLTTVGVTFILPKLYLASARIKVEQERPTIAVFEREQFPTYDPYFLQTQYEIIQSQKVLLPVIQQLDLQKKWAQDADPLPQEFAFKKLKNSLVARRYRDTSLIEIAVYDEDPTRAADIANKIAEVFELDRLAEKRRQTMKGIDRLSQELRDQEKRLTDAQTKVEKLRKDLNVPVFGQVKLTDVALQQLEQELTHARVDTVGKQAKLHQIELLSPQQLRNAIATIVNDQNVQSLLANHNEAELKLEVLKQDYGPDHPQVRSAQAAMVKLQEQLDARLEGIRRAVEVDYLVSKARFDELNKQLEEAKSSSVSVESEKFLPFRNAQREEDLERNMYEALKKRLQVESIEMEVPRSPVEVIDHAKSPRQHVRPNMMLNVAVSVVAGLILGVALAFFVEFLDTSLKRVEDIEREIGLPVLGVISQKAGLISGGEASASHIEAYRMLRTNIEFTRGDGAFNAFCMLSAGPGEGKSYTTVNLGCVYAQHGARVLIVDSDLRRPMVHKLFGLPNTVGLVDYLTGEKAVEEIIQSTKTPNVWAITTASGGHSIAALPMLTSQRMKALIQEVSRQFDVVLYDTPPILGVSDAAIVAREVGASVLVVQHRRYPRSMVQRARQQIEHTGTKLMGVVVNNINIQQDQTYYYYHDHYEAYLKAPGDRPPEPESKPAPKRKPQPEEIKFKETY